MFDRSAAAAVVKLSRIALACLLVAALSTDGAAAQDTPPLGGRLFMSVFKRVSPDELRHARQIVAVDMESGQYQEVGAPGLEPRLSPDGEQLAYWTFGTDNQAFETWIKRLGTPDEPQFLGYGQVAGWLSDGRDLAIRDPERPQDGGRWKYTNYLIDVSGANRRELKLPPNVSVIDCSADGKWLLVDGVERRQLHVMPASGGEPARVSLAAHRTYKGRLSPDGKRVAYIVSSKPDRVMIVDREGSNWRQIYRGQGLTEPDELCWSPDGNHLAIVLFDYIEENGRRIRSIAPEHDNNYRVLILDQHGKNPRPLVLEGLSVEEISSVEWK